MTPDSVMSAASFTKVAFAYMVMQLVQERVLDLDKPVYQYLPKPLPEYGLYRELAGDDRYKKITARMLLDHTSGFPNWRRVNDDRKLHIHFEPGSRFAYSGEGIALLQLIVETVTKKPLADLMRERVFQPFGMTRTGMTWSWRFEADHANGYVLSPQIQILSKHEFPPLSAETTDGNKPEAAAEFQKILDQRGVVFNELIGALAHSWSRPRLCFAGRHS